MGEHELFSADSEEQQLNRPSADDEPQDVEEAAEDEQARVDWLPEPPLLYRAIKRTIDIAFSVLALVAFSPVFLVIALAIRLTSKGPLIFLQKRVGYRGIPFELLKFRTMYVNRDPGIQMEYVKRLISGKYGAVGEQIAVKRSNDPRLTPVGRFLRRTSLDQILQFWNVLRGNMSLVGPRPPIMYEWGTCQTWHKQRLSSKPGITGLSQIKARWSTSIDEMVKLDLEYTKDPSVLLDLRILFKTVTTVFRSDKAF